MTSKKISDLTALTGANLVLADVLVVVDISSSETKSLKIEDLLSSSAFGLLPSNTIPIAKVNVSSQSIAGSAIANLGINTTQIASDAIDATKLADNSASNLTSGLPAAGGFVGQIAVNSAASYAASIWDGSAWQSLKAPDAITTIASSSTALIDIVTSLSGSTATLSANIGDSTASAQFVAGPTGESGTVTLRTISGTDLPTSTSTSLGAIKVNGEGLRLDAGVIEIDNDVTASSAFNLVSVTSKGLVSSHRAIESADLPDGTDSVKGALQVGTGLSVTNGVISLGNVVSGGTFTKATFDNSGLFVSGSTLLGTDIPAHSADLLTSGTVAAARIGANTIDREKLTDSSICIFQSVAQTSLSSTSSAFKGEMLFDTTTNELYLHDASAWRKVSGSGDSSSSSSSSSGGGGLWSSYAMLSNRITANGGTQGSVDTWNTRELSNEEFDPDDIVTFNASANSFTLQAGTYFVKCRGIFYRAGEGVGRLYNETSSEVTLRGMTQSVDEASNPDGTGSIMMPVIGRFTISGTTAQTFKYQQMHTYSNSTANRKGGWDSFFAGGGNTYVHNAEIEIYKE